MICFLCQNEIVHQSDDFKHTMWGRTGHIEISRRRYACLNCQDFYLTIDYPAEELFAFNVYLGSGYTIKGGREDVITIECAKGVDNERVTMPWISQAGTKNIMKFLEELSHKYELYVTFS